MDETTAGLLPDQYVWHREMRAATPVWYDDERRMWHVFRYDDIQRVTTDFGLFSSDYQRLIPPERRKGASSLLASDPPLHRKLRGLATQAFTPQAVAALEPRIRAIVSARLDAVSADGQMDVIRDLADPLPVTIIAELLGIPAEAHADFKRWSDAVIIAGGQDPVAAMSGQQRYLPELAAYSEYFTSLIEQRRAQPENDLISQLTLAQIDGEHLTQAELLAFCSLLLIAGNETTTNLIGAAMLCLEAYPAAWAQLRADPSLIPSAIEEVLRYRSVAKAVIRVTAADTLLAGQAIPANSLVIAWITSANHDSTQFSDPERFDITRAPNRHLSFGHGIHYCLGAPLARLETRIALELMLQRFAQIQRVPDAPVQFRNTIMLAGVQSLPLRFTLAS
jgi:cytochrome P450